MKKVLYLFASILCVQGLAQQDTILFGPGVTGRSPYVLPEGPKKNTVNNPGSDTSVSEKHSKVLYAFEFPSEQRKQGDSRSTSFPQQNLAEKWGNNTIMAPGNDNCGSATTLSTGTLTSQTNASSNVAGTDPVGCAYTGFGNTGTVWYTYTPASTGNVTFVVTGTGGSPIGYPTISVFSGGSCSGFTTSYSCGSGTSSTATVTINCAVSGTTYYIMVASDYWNGWTGAFSISTTFSAVSAPANDACASATALTFSTINNALANTVTYSASATGTNACATSDQASTSCYTNNKNVWYKFTPPVTGSYYVGVNAGTIVYPEVAVLSGSCGSFSTLGCAGSTTVTAQPYGYLSSSYSYAGGCSLTAGTTYYVMVDNYLGYSPGTFTINVVHLSNDDIPAAGIIASCGTAFTSSTIGATNCGNCLKTGSTVLYTNLDCNTGTTASGNSGGADVYNGMSVENDSWYQFCTTTAQIYSVTVAPTLSTCIGPGYGTAALQVTFFTGSSSALNYLQGYSTNTSLTYTISLAANACAYIHVDGFSGENCDYNVTLAASPGCPLPLELYSFKGEVLNDQRNELSWVLGSEKDVYYYLVERSKDGNEYSPVTKVFSKGTSNQKTVYKGIDPAPLAGNNFYRLSAVDKNGVQNIAAHTMIANKVSLPNFTVFPNPNNGQLVVNLTNFSSGSVLVEIYDAYGKLHLSSSMDLENGGLQKQFDLSGFENGVYFVKAFDGNNYFIKSLLISKGN